MSSRGINAPTFQAIAARLAGGASPDDEVRGTTVPASDVAGPLPEVGWVNLWRRSDFIGGRIVDDDWTAAGLFVPVNLEERELADPYPVAVPPYSVTHPPALRHSAYWHDPGYFQALDDLVRSFAASSDACIPQPPGTVVDPAPRTVL